MTDQELSELNCWIAKHVMGEHRTTVCPDCFGTGYTGSECDHNPCDLCKTSGKVKPYFNSPDYSTDAAAAMLVLEKCINNQRELYAGDSSFFISKDGPLFWIRTVRHNSHVEGQADTLPLAICLFAQKLFGTETEKL